MKRGEQEWGQKALELNLGLSQTVFLVDLRWKECWRPKPWKWIPKIIQMLTTASYFCAKNIHMALIVPGDAIGIEISKKGSVATETCNIIHVDTHHHMKQISNSFRVWQQNINTGSVNAKEMSKYNRSNDAITGENVDSYPDNKQLLLIYSVSSYKLTSVAGDCASQHASKQSTNTTLNAFEVNYETIQDEVKKYNWKRNDEKQPIRYDA